MFTARIEYVERPTRFQVFPASLEKLGNALEVDAFSHLCSPGHTVEDGLVDTGVHKVYYTRKFGYFLAFLDKIPRMTGVKTGERRLPSELKELHLSTNDEKKCAISFLSSSTLFWFWNTLSDCRNLNRRDILAFPLSPKVLTTSRLEQLAELGEKYLKALKKTSQMMTKSGLKIETFNYAKCKPILDEIDDVLRTSFGLDADQCDFIVNYDIKYRMGVDVDVDF